MAELDPTSKYAEEVIAERSLTMEDGREHGQLVQQQQTNQTVTETPVRQGGDDGDGL